MLASNCAVICGRVNDKSEIFMVMFVLHGVNAVMMYSKFINILLHHMQGVFKITGVRSMIFDQYLELEFDMIFSIVLKNRS